MSDNDQQRYSIDSSMKLNAWMQSSPAGISLLQEEQRSIDSSAKNIFGYYGCQASIVDNLTLLENCQIGHHFKLTFDNDNAHMFSGVRCEPYFWPVEPSSLDLVLLHHVLDVAESPHRLLGEAAKSVMADGKLLIIGFNPCSLYGISRWVAPKKTNIFKEIKFIRVSRLIDWLSLLGFAVGSVSYGSYINPLEQFFKVSSRDYIEQLCTQWKLPFGCFYSIVATREVYGVSLLRKSRANISNNLIGQPAARSSAGSLRRL